MFNFPYTNFHDLNLDWLLEKIKELFNTAVFTVNNTAPDENGNVNLSGVSGVTAVCGIGADGQGNVPVTGANIPMSANDPGTVSTSIYALQNDIQSRAHVVNGKTVANDGTVLITGSDIRMNDGTTETIADFNSNIHITPIVNTSVIDSATVTCVADKRSGVASFTLRGDMTQAVSDLTTLVSGLPGPAQDTYAVGIKQDRTTFANSPVVFRITAEGYITLTYIGELSATDRIIVSGSYNMLYD